MPTSSAAPALPAAALYDPTDPPPLRPPDGAQGAAPGGDRDAARVIEGTAVILPLLPKQRTCATCQRPLPRHAPARHRHCEKCHDWHRAAYFLALSRWHLARAEGSGP